MAQKVILVSSIHIFPDSFAKICYNAQLLLHFWYFKNIQKIN